jgi:hypothetical protein
MHIFLGPDSDKQFTNKRAQVYTELSSVYYYEVYFHIICLFTLYKYIVWPDYLIICSLMLSFVWETLWNGKEYRLV